MRKRIRRRSVRKSNRIRNIFLNIGLILCVIVFLVFGWKLIDSLLEYHRGEEAYENIINGMVDTTDISDTDNEEETDILPDIDWASLKSINNDLVGWLYIPGTTIHYPIVQGADNDFYLRRTFEGANNSCGCIFMDMHNKADFTSDNTIIHGHNMRNKTMFGTLREYENKSYWEAHPYIWIIKEKTAMKYEIFSSGITTTAGDVYVIEFGSKESFENYILKRTKTDVFYETGVEVTTDDRLLTLSTCTSDTETGRRVVQAKFVDEKVIH